MPFINSLGTASSRGYGFTRGGGGPDVITGIKLKFGLAENATSLTVPTDTWQWVDLSAYSGSSKVITVSCAGTKGGGFTAGGGGGNGATLTGTIPTSALAGKIIGLVSSYTYPTSYATGRDSSAGGGFSGLIQLDPTSYTTGGTLTHFITAAGGGGACGAGDNGNGAQSGGGASSILYSGSPSGGTSYGKDTYGNTGYYPSLPYAGHPGNKFGGGDSASDVNAVDQFMGGSGGGFGPRRGVRRDGQGDPSGFSTGYSMGFGHQQANHIGTEKVGAIGGGGFAGGGASGGVAWRVISSGGGGGGFQGGSTGYYSDGLAQNAFGGVSFCGNGASVVSFSGSSSTNGYCNISWVN